MAASGFRGTILGTRDDGTFGLALADPAPDGTDKVWLRLEDNRRGKTWFLTDELIAATLKAEKKRQSGADDDYRRT